MREFHLKPDKPGWRPIELTLDGREVGRSDGLFPRLAAFSIALESRGTIADVDNIRLLGPQGQPWIANGDFSQEMAHWFFTSDRNHMPWHIKSLFANALFDQGAFGLATFLALSFGALGRVTLGRGREHPLAPFLAASIAGFLVVGLFDSLVDAPRIALLFYLIVMVALVLKPERWQGAGAPAAASG